MQAYTVPRNTTTRPAALGRRKPKSGLNLGASPEFESYNRVLTRKTSPGEASKRRGLSAREDVSELRRRIVLATRGLLAPAARRHLPPGAQASRLHLARANLGFVSQHESSSQPL